MSRFALFAPCVLTCSLFVIPAGADDPPKKLTAEERKELVEKLIELNSVGLKAHRAGKYTEAGSGLQEALLVARQRSDRMPGDAADRAGSAR